MYSTYDLMLGSCWSFFSHVYLGSAKYKGGDTNKLQLTKNIAFVKKVYLNYL